jgi:hypothetical protein
MCGEVAVTDAAGGCRLASVVSPGGGGARSREALVLAAAAPGVGRIDSHRLRRGHVEICDAEARSCGATAYVHKADFEAPLLQAIYASRSAR